VNPIARQELWVLKKTKSQKSQAKKLLKLTTLGFKVAGKFGSAKV
jgi:hypothetical protein